VKIVLVVAGNLVRLAGVASASKALPPIDGDHLPARAMGVSRCSEDFV
jgi:hypothetical protein